MRQVSKQTALAIVVGVTVAISGIMTGCTAQAGGVLPEQVESPVGSNGTADDHLAAALLYQQKAQRAQAEAARYEREASSISPIEDPKGFRRNALLTAAKERRQEAAEMQQLYAAHQAKAQTMTGKQQPQ